MHGIISTVSGWLGSLLLSICGIPQAIRCIKTGNATGMSNMFIWMWFWGEVFTLYYILSFEKVSLPLVVNYSANISSLIVIIYYKYFGDTMCEEPDFKPAKICNQSHKNTRGFDLGIEVRFCERVNGSGLFATKEFKEGEKILCLCGREFEHPSKYTIYVGNGKHVLDEYGMAMNHSFLPSTRVVNYDVFALRNIAVGEELNFNYNETEPFVSCPFESEGIMVTGNPSYS